MSLRKRIISCACAFVLLAGTSAALPQGFDRLGASLEACAEIYGYYNYTVLDDGTAEITRYNGYSSSVTVPDEINSRKVTRIGDYAFENLSIESVTIPEGVTGIGKMAFSQCFYLESVNLPDSITAIGDSAFGRCFRLESITLPEGLKRIEQFAFFQCDSLKKITIPKSTESIGYGALGYHTETSVDDFLRLPGFTILCYRNTAGQQYAVDNSFAYEILDKPLTGDANKDEKVNMKDLVLVQRYLNGWDVEIDLTVCDINHDKKVNMKDYVALQRQLNGWT